MRESEDGMYKTVHPQLGIQYVTVRAIVNEKNPKVLRNDFSCSPCCHWQRKKCISFLFQVPRQVRICYFITTRCFSLFTWFDFIHSLIEISQHLSRPPAVVLFMGCKQSWGAPRSWPYGLMGESIRLNCRWRSACVVMWVCSFRTLNMIAKRRLSDLARGMFWWMFTLLIGGTRKVRSSSDESCLF